MGFKVTKNGKLLGDSFDSREEAMESARLEKLADPSAEVKVEVFVTVGGDNPQKDAQDLVDAILEGEDFSDLPPEHRGPIHASAKEGDEATGEKEAHKQKESDKADPPKRCYFASFTRSMLVRDEDLENLWDDDKIAIHIPGLGGSPDLESLDPEDYPKFQQRTMTDLLKLGVDGVYVWCESYLRGEAKVGIIRPGTEIENSPATYVEPKHPKHESKAGKPAILKTFQMERVKMVKPDEETMLRVSRPAGHIPSRIIRWSPACGEARLIALIEGDGAEEKKLGWDGLSADLKTTLCIEFLRRHRNSDYPRLTHLLLSPGRRPTDVDIYGISEDGKEMFVQVPFTKYGKHEVHEADEKARRLKNYRGSDRILISFRPGDLAPRPEQRSLLKKPVPMEMDGILYIPAKEVHDWLRENPDYDERVFGL